MLAISMQGWAQVKETIAVIGINCKDIKFEKNSMSNLVRLELEKAKTYEVFDQYKVANS